MHLDSKEQAEMIFNTSIWQWLKYKINMKHTYLEIIQEPSFPFKPPSSVKIILDLLEPYKKKEPKGMIRRKDQDTILNIKKPCLVIAYTDGSSDLDCNRGQSCVFLTYPNGSTSKQ